MGNVLDRDREREKFAERIPAQMILLNQLFHVFGCRATRAGFEQAAACHQRHDREHLRAGAEFHDREQVS